MHKGQGLRRYFYEYLFHNAVETARADTGQVLPISQAKAIRRRIDTLLAEAGTSVADPRLEVKTYLDALDSTMTSMVEGARPRFATYSVEDPDYQRLQSMFMSQVGMGETPWRSPVLPISPYDPQWSERSTIKQGGTSLSYIPDETIMRATDGRTEALTDMDAAPMMVWRFDADNKPVKAGWALTDDDASGLTSLMDKMSEAEYAQVRGWVIDGARDPRSGQIDRNRFMSSTALARSVAILDELQYQGLGYEISKDQNPGQIKARISGTGMEIRLTEPREREEYAGARIYDNGMIVRYSTNHKIGQGRTAVYSPSPDEAVDLLRFAQGHEVKRRDIEGAMVGEPGSTHVEMVRHGRSNPEPTPVQDSYHVGKVSMFAVADYTVPSERPRMGSKVMLRREATDRSLADYFVDEAAAETYLVAAVQSARENLQSALAVDELVAEFELRRAVYALGETDEIEQPEFSGDSEVSAIQQAYWDVLTGQRSELVRPGATEEMYTERLGAIGELGAEDTGLDLGNLVYGGTPEEKVRAHADEVLDEIVGTYEAQPRLIDGELVDRRFDPIRVARYMTSSGGQWSNLDNLASALRRVQVEPAELLGSGFQNSRFNDRLVRFDPTTARSLDERSEGFLGMVGRSVRASLERNAAVVTDVAIDAQGVIRWSADKVRRDGSTVPVVGEIGQVFDRGERAQEIVTQFASGDNALIIPGFEARIRPQVPGETKSVEERTLLRGYEQLMMDKIEYQIAGDLLSGRSEVGEGSSLNGVYSQIYGTRHPVDYIESNLEADGSLNRWTEAILATEARRVRYDNSIKDGSTIFAEYRSQHHRNDPADDNHFDAWQLTGGRNMAVLTGADQDNRRAPEGYFDPMMTGGATNQGIVRYLTQDAEIRPDGQIIPGDPSTQTGSRAPLMMLPELETMAFDPFDRQQMTVSTIMQSASITEPTGTALMTFGGWTADDPIVVSKEFAEKQLIYGVGGQLRALVVGDKISDLHGNKGVISLIVDREMDDTEAMEQDLIKEVEWFRANPQMDVVMSPFSLIGRRNAGAARELMNGEVAPLIQPADFTDGEEWKPAGTEIGSGLGQMRFIVTHMAVDEKTKVYDDEQVLAGRGRKASSQLAWALHGQGCPAIMAEFYGHNSGAEANLREYMLSVGLDMEADGTLAVVGGGVNERGLSLEVLDEGPKRRLFEMPELQHTTNGGLNTTAMRRSFGTLIGDKGGDLEIPFPLTYPTGVQTEQLTATSWKMPVLSSHLRSGQEFDDGSVSTHDYTTRYLDIFEQSCRYRALQEKLDNPALGQADRESLTDEMSKTVLHAQRKFESITTDLEQRVFSGKKNIFKTGLMSSRLSDSATAVWTADPRLDIDQVGIGPVMAEQLGLTEGDHALIWRDPILRDSGLRYMRVSIDERLTGVAINPVMDKCFDGDFDGDSVAVVKLHSNAAKREAMQKLSVAANLLDTGEVSERGTHPFAMQVSLDTRVAISKSEFLEKGLMSLSGEANLNAIEPSYDSEEMNASVRQRNRDGNVDLVRRLSDFYRLAQREEFGSALNFASAYEHVESIDKVCVQTGAKGSRSKLGAYARNLGLEVDAANNWYTKDLGVSGLSQADQEASMFATAIKAHGTGPAGTYSQRGVKALRDVDIKAVYEITYPVTQSVLQAKHDAAEARHKYDMVQGPARDLWRGRKIERSDRGQWRTVYDNGETVRLDAKAWAAQVVDFYQSKDGFNVSINPAYVDRVAEALADPRTGEVRNLEEDPALKGTLMDKMAYGGTLPDLVAAARQRENLFEGMNAQFASAETRRAILEVPAAVVKPDVMAESQPGAKVRGARRTSDYAVTVSRPRYTPSIPIEQPEEDDASLGMGV